MLHAAQNVPFISVPWFLESLAHPVWEKKKEKEKKDSGKEMRERESERASAHEQEQSKATLEVGEAPGQLRTPGQKRPAFCTIPHFTPRGWAW